MAGSVSNVRSEDEYNERNRTLLHFGSPPGTKYEDDKDEHTELWPMDWLSRGKDEDPPEG